MRSAHGRGGRSGIYHEVRLDTLPFDLQERLKALSKASKTPLRADDAASAEREWWYSVIQPALVHPRGSRERGEAIRQIAAAKHMRRNGTWQTVDARTIHRKLSAYENGQGLKGLTRRKRADAGQTKVILTRRWDASELAEEVKREIAAKVRQRIKDLWASAAAPSDIHHLTAGYLVDLTRAARAQANLPMIDDVSLSELCRIPDHLVEAQRRYKKVAVFDRDRKQHEDNRRRVRRTSAGYDPMHVVFADIHHMDVLVRREDGSLATPKAIAWLDIATNRGRIDWVLADKGKGIRNADVIDSFLRMTQDPHWGLPKHLYVDNGSEYNWADFISDAMKLANFEPGYLDARNPIIRALPYNASAKPIEGFFGNIERTVFAPMPGQIGGNRMNKRVGTVGREPTPFDGHFLDFCDRAQGVIQYHNSKPQTRGWLKGRSPNDAYRRAVEAGWQRSTIDPHELMMAFSVAETRKVIKGVVSVGGEPYTCDELAHFNGETVQVLKPKFTDWSALPVLTSKGAFIGIANLDQPYGYLDGAGAREADRRRKLDIQAIAALKQETQQLDVTDMMIGSVNRQLPLPQPETSAFVQVTDQMRHIGNELAKTPQGRLEAKNAADQRAQRERLATLKRHMRGEAS